MSLDQTLCESHARFQLVQLARARRRASLPDVVRLGPFTVDCSRAVSPHGRIEVRADDGCLLIVAYDKIVIKDPVLPFNVPAVQELTRRVVQETEYVSQQLRAAAR